MDKLMCPLRHIEFFVGKVYCALYVILNSLVGDPMGLHSKEIQTA